MKYLGIEPNKPTVAVFDFTGCEGCELQLANKEETLTAFLQAVEVVGFREISSAQDAGGEIDVALIDGAITREDEVKRLKRIRQRASLVVALGTCACFGGVSRMKNDLDLEAANQQVYGGDPRPTLPTRPICEVVLVDLEIPGCPVSKDEVERIVQHLIWDVPFSPPAYPVCLECKQRFAVCLFETGQLCLGPITHGGCDAPCPVGGLGCLGCRGPAADPNYDAFLAVASERGFHPREVDDRLRFFGGFEDLRKGMSAHEG